MENLTFLDLHPGDILLCKGEGWICDFLNNPVAACVSPRDIKGSSDLKSIGRLSFK